MACLFLILFCELNYTLSNFWYNIYINMSKKEVIPMGQEIEQLQFSNPKLKEVLP